MNLSIPNEPLVSILMTVYNREKYIAEAIESVIQLQYTNWELIICDDCSTDNSVNVAKRYVEKDNRVKVYKNDMNLGDYPNRNRAASYARGKYLKYLDSDDLIYPHGLGVMVDALERFSEAAFALSYSKPEDTKPYPFALSPRETFYEHFLGRGVLNCGPSGTIVRRDVFETEGGFNVQRFVGDTELWLRLASKYTIVKMHPALIWWRVHEGQEIYAERKETAPMIMRYILNKNVLESTLCPLIESERILALRKLRQHQARHILRLGLAQNQIRAAYSIFKETNLDFFELLSGFKPYVS